MRVYRLLFLRVIKEEEEQLLFAFQKCVVADDTVSL